MKSKLLLALIVLGITFGAIFIYFKANGVFIIKDSSYTQTEQNENPNSNIDTTPNTNTANREKINIYLFWGDGCNRCEEMMAFLDEIDDEYGKYYNLVKYEVWKNEENNQLMHKFGEALSETVRGVPYLIIGDVSISGYNETKENYIKETILEQYNNDDFVDMYEKVMQ